MENVKNEGAVVGTGEVVVVKKLKEMTKEELGKLPSYVMKLLITPSKDRSFETYSAKIHLVDGIDVSVRLQQGTFYSILKGRELLPLKSNSASCPVKVRVQKGVRTDQFGHKRPYYLWECIPSLKAGVYLHDFFQNGTVSYLQMSPELETQLQVVDRGESVDDELEQIDGYQDIA